MSLWTQYFSKNKSNTIEVSSLCPVLADTLGKGGVLLVKSSEQGLVFGAYVFLGVLFIYNLWDDEFVKDSD